MYPNMQSNFQYVPYQGYNYQNVDEEQPKTLLKQESQVQATQQVTDSNGKIDKEFVESLDKPINSLPFLEKYHQSARNVERLAQTVKNASYGVGMLGGVCFVLAGFCLLGNSAIHNSQMTQNSSANAAHPKLQSGMLDSGIQSEIIDSETGEFNVKALSGTFSMIIWGMIMAKAKSGYTAAISKDHTQVQSQYKNVLTLFALIAVATFAQWKFEGQSQKNIQSTQPATQSKGRNLEASNPIVAVTDEVEIVDYKTLYENAQQLWRNSISKDQKKSSIVLESSNVETATQDHKVKSQIIIQGAKGAVKWIGSIIFFAICFAYGMILRQYHLAVQKHQQMTELFYNPNVRVASGENASKVLDSIKPKVEEVEQLIQAPAQQQSVHHLNQFENLHQKISEILKNAQNIQKPHMQVAAPTLKNLPPSLKSENNFNYSLCESIDYQQESLAAPLLDTRKEQNKSLAIERLQQILSQKQSSQNQQVQQIVQEKPKLQQAVIENQIQAAPQAQQQVKVITMSREEFEKQYGQKLPEITQNQASAIIIQTHAKDLVEETSINMTITKNNSME
ncbi:UNKNOWN [Stylonychia lemnae]|uniref:Transmembrane protein n=1 Tax=Stylonychia lemnae TaxID=5949 RepID=A0A078AC50_STYLE|nr:UNKNOWN [Stylonychia lemnae]|eukprot:CDW79411.1 UNKNOWN [Stylonychia lemnae]